MSTKLIEEVRERLRSQARVALGVTGSKEDSRPLPIGHQGLGRYPLIALSLLVIADEFQSFGFAVLGPEISRSLGIGAGALAGVLALKTLALTLSTLPMAALVQRRARRASIAILTGLAWSLLTIGTGFVANIWGLLLILIADGASSGSVQTLHAPLLLDSYPPAARVRALSIYRAAAGVGNVGAPLLVAALSILFDFSWRGIFIAMGITSLTVALFAIRLRDPGFGRWDLDRVRSVVRQDLGYGEERPTEDVGLGFFESVRRLLLIPTIRRLLAGWAVLGMLLVPLYTYLFFFLEDRWGLGPGARGLFYAAMAACSIVALYWFAPRGERIFRRDPARLQQHGATFLGVGVLCLALGIFAPIFVLMAALFGIAFSLIALLAPTLNVTMLSVVAPRMRPHASALAGIFLAAVGGFGGLFLLSGIDRRFGTAGAIVSLALPGIASALVLRSAARTVNEDLDRLIDETVEGEELKILMSKGTQFPMLSCRHIDFSYESVQVLFDVDFEIKEGEIVALLGTNGAGKSTLLKVISGICLPSRGSVRLRGADITYVDAERRTELGITQIPGGRGVFGPLSVAQNLRLMSYSLGRKRAAAERGIQEALEVFPALAERLDQRASTLSGGEQQMLALAKAFIVKPRLLLVDELSLGLAPKVIVELMAMVRRINDQGAAVLIVEQSVGIALSLAERAYFMEKGEIQFAGPADRLRDRRDLLRSVFLEGAASSFPE